MRKGEFRLKAKREADNRGNIVFVFYKACAYRWDENFSADPEIEGVKFFIDFDEAKDYANSINLNVGFKPIIEICTIGYTDFNEQYEFGDEFELCEIDMNGWMRDVETIWSGDTNLGL